LVPKGDAGVLHLCADLKLLAWLDMTMLSSSSPGHL
jgi:hypothetical protein